MSHVLKDAKVFLGPYNLSGYSNSVALQYGAEPLDETTLSDSTRKMKGGLKIVSAGVDGFWGATPDAGLATRLGVTATAADVHDAPFTVVTPSATAAGQVAYFFQAMEGSYTLGGAVGELMNYGAEARATADLIRGKLIYHDTATATGSGAPFSFPTMAAGDTLWGALHVFSAPTGGALDVIVQSDTATGFPSPATQLTFTQVATGTITSEFQSATGVLADSYMRVNYTPAGSCTFAVVLGIT